MNMYKELYVWKESVELIKNVYKKAAGLPKSEEFNMKQQLKRSVVSVALNIAEGKNRRSSKEFASFLTVSVASLAEVDSVLCICEELEMVKCDMTLHEQIEVLGRRINALKNKICRSI
ncbi:MAG: four helix bundle protein [Candidatus Goldbacteria bacterium]|nr:four helix bundle protein [Candidatus Goldiibacteriota bacterium]